ncbi:NADH-quinone oxidoreductase subunit C [Segetibacter sp.]|jgi:NADH-quinone oxidoreductase subunit C|uniref:NADH-quinone oxidoreductase subunit C n=1 Tax=Segetibacter sp. TaxID=2231182 RepID=UPI0026073E4D|nr:NADH-quinone oxidoreductase subunit C [Segetibacter sp.]MCW3078755.1 NADH-quinone oxidoreductase subunit [Segetibacter sp.]
MPLANPDIIQRLVDKFGESVTEFGEPYGMLTFSAPREMNLKVMGFLYNEQDLAFKFLTDLCAVHYPERKGEELAVVYHLHNLVENVRIRFKVYMPIEQPDVFTATGLFEAANWMERETYDFFGVNFIGHPNLKRILNVEEMDYFPMRKEFPLEDQSRIDKDDEMFGRGGSIDFGNREVSEEPKTISEADKDKTWL